MGGIQIFMEKMNNYFNGLASWETDFLLTTISGKELFICFAGFCLGIVFCLMILFIIAVIDERREKKCMRKDKR